MFNKFLKKLQNLFRSNEMMQFNRKPKELIKFKDYIDTVYLVYDFNGTDNQLIRYISDKNRILLPVITILSFYEFLKITYHAIVDSFIARLYLCDLVIYFS